MVIGVVPDWMVAWVAATGTKTPSDFSLPKKSMPGWTLSRLPPLASDGGQDAGQRRVGLGRVAVERDLRLVLRVVQGLQGGRRVLHLVGVVADGDVASVVVVPKTLGVLLRVGDLRPGGDLVGRELAGRGAGGGGGLADVHDVRGAALAGQLLDRVQLVLAGAVRVGVVDLDAVLGGEGVHDGAVVGPGLRQRYDVQRAFLLRGGDEGVHAAQIGGAGGLRSALARSAPGRGAAAAGGALARRAGGRAQGEDDRGGGDARQTSIHSFLPDGAASSRPRSPAARTMRMPGGRKRGVR